MEENMGMIPERELAERCAAGSLGGTLGRLGESLGRLSRVCHAGSRDQPAAEPEGWFVGAANLARLTQAWRAMADDWQPDRQAGRCFGRLEDELDRLKDETMLAFGPRGARPVNQGFEYQMLAQTLESLQAGPAYVM